MVRGPKSPYQNINQDPVIAHKKSTITPNLLRTAFLSYGVLGLLKLSLKTSPSQFVELLLRRPALRRCQDSSFHATRKKKKRIQENYTHITKNKEKKRELCTRICDQHVNMQIPV